jgi:hypothetical protein
LEYQRHLDEIDELVREANANQTLSPVKGDLKPLNEKDRAISLTWIRSKITAADLEERRKFCEMVEGVEF